jgi:hypothetical protein
MDIMADMVPLEWLIVAIMIVGGIAGVFFFLWIKNKGQSGEGKTLDKCRSENIPCLKVVDISTGHAKFFPGVKDEDNDPYFEIPGLPMKIDPSMCTGDCRPERYGNGLNIWNYATPKSLPLSVDSILSYKTMIAHRNDRAAFRKLSDIPPNELFSLIRIAKKYIEAAAPSYIAKYKIEGLVLDDEKPGVMPTNEFVEIIEQMKSFFAALPVETGFYCTQAAFSSLPYAHSSQDTERIKYLMEEKAQQEQANNQKLIQYAFMFCMVLAALGGLIAILLVLAPK